MDMNDFNQAVIAEFRANGGRVGGDLEGADLLLLHHTGARSGVERVTPLMYRREGDAWVVFASKGGAPTHPDWYRNLAAHPDTLVEVGSATVPVRAREADGAERERLWAAQKRDVPQFAGYEASTERVIPVVLLEPR